MTPQIAKAKMIACACLLLPLLLKEQAHIQLPNLICRPRELIPRVTCDICSSALFSSCWFCSLCGRELCEDCHCDMLTTQTAKCSSLNGIHVLLPVTRFKNDEVINAIVKMELILKGDKTPQEDNEV
ncbi:hypothetical protein PILCRDRAFT_812429 [Piloderma croceum F 1598]|uniref:B box-type domain-containing protein n=1 Tax=Piloderma croceum (strain F 1598) TaxID=765440 RepID=A0A0C3BSW7_PILCF|nr:hypothetical protein PILCRDRAFT_812429 [Piloderma croceum F 1598]